jgi:ABC-type tungstate transport system permease subunit
MNRSLLLGLVAGACLLLTPALASADSSSTLTVIGTSDVSDSGLIQNVIQPDFHAAYPQYTFKYVGTASGTAIADAENGSQNASALIVHAATLENQFVASAYSYNNRYGYAIFRNDFVLAGPSADPARVSVNAASNIAQAFADIAAAGVAGKATFVARGNTSGTSVAEHQIWALLDSSGLAPSGLLLCTLSSGNGGGQTPIGAGNGVTANGQECPSSGALPSGTELPSWYAATGLTQGPNVVATNACTGYTSGANSCYVFTDRGTFDYLASGLDPAGAIPSLAILTRNDSSSAPGGADELINYFHAYVINPSKPGESVNLPAAQAFVSMLTSPAVQAQLKTYLDDTVDPAGPPFIADASPVITEIGLPKTDNAGTPVTVSGSVTNAEPGYPALSDITVTADELVAGLPVPVASTTTNSSGGYSLRFKPASSGAYQISTGQISKIENSYYNPVFGDILSPAATTAVALSVTGLPISHAVGFRKLSVKRGKLTVTGTLKPAPALHGASVELFALRTTGTAPEKVVGKASVAVGKTTFTIKAKLARGFHWIVQLEYVQKGQTTSYSKLAVLDVK